ncbi:hypothetical protein JY651_34860 [Pyxidicoccus parkwayensis]|uniref:Lipoprotein n=1 Tax=Pyxidicoccus parkwayensis TaxID=2813578 RepID=A0ABX7NNZ6_9BACT|nr:hypothetical protein [Pyxidicoccus parkwaysis]QSQ20403.1 hypothetical protein JY651_34860 [Pyxidicoccus parkwaysis]
MSVSIVFAVGCARDARPTGPGTGPVGKGTVYSGPGGEVVSVVPLLPPEDHKFLIHLQVPGDDYDGKVLLHTATPDGMEFWARWRGRNMRLFQERKSSGRKTGDFMVLALLKDDLIHLTPDSARTAALKSEDVQELYLRQLADGTLARGEAFDTPFWSKDHDRSLTEAAKALNTSCGSQVVAAITWDALPRKLLEDGEPIGSYCAEPLEALKRLCDESEEARRTVQAKIKRLDCRAGERFGGRFDADTVVWSIAPGMDRPGPEQTAQFFMDSL